MDQFNEMSKDDQIAALCNYHQCSDKKRLSHARAYLEGWNCHPPQRFVEWWKSNGDVLTEKITARAWVGVGAVTAFNCQAVRDVYRDAKAADAI